MEIIYGIHTVTAVLSSRPQTIQKIMLLESRTDKPIQNILALAAKNSIAIEKADRQQLDELTKNENHQGVVARIQSSLHYSEDFLQELITTKPQPLLLILDQVQDPHNLGACLRVADAVGVDAVIIPKDRSTSITPLVRKVASGAAEVIPVVQVTNLARTLKQLQKDGIWLYGFADSSEQSLYETEFSGGIGIVMGAEGHGMRALTQEICDFILKIPMQGFVSSLNVSVATGVVLYEVYRQRASGVKS